MAPRGGEGDVNHSSFDIVFLFLCLRLFIAARRQSRPQPAADLFVLCRPGQQRVIQRNVQPCRNLSTNTGKRTQDDIEQTKKQKNKKYIAARFIVDESTRDGYVTFRRTRTV